MLIFAHMGMIKINKNNFLIYHTTNFIAKKLYFKKKIKNKRGAHQDSQMTKEKNSLLLNICETDLTRPIRYIYIITKSHTIFHRYVFLSLKVPMQRCAILFQPSFCTFDTRTIQITYSRPKFWRMIHMLCMR